MTETRTVEGGLLQGEATFERALRPRNFAEYVGQAGIVDNLKVFIDTPEFLNWLQTKAAFASMDALKPLSPVDSSNFWVRRRRLGVFNLSKTM